MEEKIFDQEIKDALLKATDTSLNLKDDIWEGIESKLEYYQNQKGGKTMKKNKFRSVFAALTLTAAALCVVFFTSTNAGRAAVAKLREILLRKRS